MSPEALNSFFSLAIGFAFAGVLASGYQALARRPAGFGLLNEGVVPKAFAAVPFLVFAAPFIMVRDAIRVRRSGGENFIAGMVVSMIAGAWSLMSGRVVIQAMNMLGLG